MGGYCNGNPIDSIYIYYPDNDFWSLSFNRLPEPMAYHKATVLDDYVYVYDKDSTGQFGRLWRYKFAYLNTEDEIVFNEPAIKIFPNPSSGSFRIEFREKPVEQMQVMVFNILGKEVISIDRKLKEKEYLDIDMNNQNKGIYFVRIQQGERKYCKPVIIH
jgi:hypothetical protein